MQPLSFSKQTVFFFSWRIRSTRSLSDKKIMLDVILRLKWRGSCHARYRTLFPVIPSTFILGDPRADIGGEGKSKWEGKYGTKKSKERQKEPLGTMSYQTSSKRLPPFCLLIGQKNTKVFWHQSEARTAATVWNWSGKTLSPGALFAVLYFSSCHIFLPV